MEHLWRGYDDGEKFREQGKDPYWKNLHIRPQILTMRMHLDIVDPLQRGGGIEDGHTQKTSHVLEPAEVQRIPAGSDMYDQ